MSDRDQQINQQQEQHSSSFSQNEEQSSEGQTNLTPQIIISWRYNQQKKILNLDGSQQFCMQVLNDRNWDNIEVLWLNKCSIDDQILHKIVQMQNLWKYIKSLRLGNNKITHQGVKLLLQSKTIDTSKFVYLNLQYNNINTNGLKILSKFDLPVLQILILNHVNINAQGMAHLTKSNCKELMTLQTSSNSYMSMGFYLSLGLCNWKKLKKFQIWTQNDGFMQRINIILIPHNNGLQQYHYFRNNQINTNYGKIIKQKFYSSNYYGYY